MTEKKKANKEKWTKIDESLKRNLKKYTPLLIWLGVLAVIFVVFYLLFNGLGKVEYGGLTFTKEKYGEVILYHYYYSSEVNAGKLRRIDVLLRGNPAENNVSFDGRIIYPEGKTVFISINNSQLNECKYSPVALSSYSIFIANNGLLLKAGTPDEKEAQRNNLTYVTCGKYPGNIIISLKAGNESRIKQTTGICYDATVSNCEILQVMEKLIIQSIIEAKNFTGY